MVRSLDDDFVGADAVHLVVHALALAVQFAFDAQHGEFVGDYAHAPTRLVTASAVAVSQDLGRSFMLIAITEGADSLAGWRHRLADKIAGPLGAIGGDNHPSPGDGVLT